MTDGAIITRCPGCATAFRASETQLVTRGGHVRCGRCETVFDAYTYALPENMLPTSQSAESPRPPEALEPQILPEALVLTPSPAQDPQPANSDESVADTPAIDTPAEIADPNLELDFGRSKPHAAAISAWIAWPATVVTAFVLAAQIAFHFRGDLTLAFPAVKPYAEELCAELGCDLPLPSRSDMMSIESSDLQADTINPGVMVLSATIRNRAPYAQLPPALELTLTDPQDRPMARRVLAASEYLARGATYSSFPASTEIPIKVFFDASAVKATGYRLYLFYP